MRKKLIISTTVAVFFLILFSGLILIRVKQRIEIKPETGLPQVLSAQPTDSFTIEAENFTTKTGINTLDESNTSGGKYVEFINNTGFISTTFTTGKSGNYLIVPYVYFDLANERKYTSVMGDANTMYISVDGGAETQIGQIADYNRWFYLSGFFGNLSAGSHTLKIRGREWPNRVDLVVVHEINQNMDPYPNTLFTNKGNPPYVWKDGYWAVQANQFGQQSWRMEIGWANEEPIPGYYQWDRIDAILAGLRNINSNWTIVAIAEYGTGLRYGPAWAAPAGPYTPERIAAYGNFVGQAIKHLGTQNIVYEIINEPNNGGSSATYASLLKSAYVKAKEANSGARVLFGGTLGVVQSWIQQVFSAGGLGNFDEMNIHPYQGYYRSFEEEGMDKVLENFAAFLRSNNVDPSKTWWTEWGELVRNEECCHTQSRIISRQMLIGIKNGFSVARMIPYVFEGGTLWGQGKPNDAGLAFKFIQQNFNKATYQGSLQLPPDTRGLLFKRDSDQILAVYSLDSPAQKITISGFSSVTLYNYLGNQQSAALSNGSIVLTVDGDVQYLVIPSGDQPSTTGYNYGANFAAASSGVKATASSEKSGNPVSYIIDGIANANGTINSYQWNDNNPGQFPDWVEIDLGKEQELNTIILYMHSNNSSPGSLRDFDLQVLQGASWKTIQEVRGNYNYWVLKYQFAPLTASKIRINILSVNEGLNNACCGGDKSVLYSRLYEVEAYRIPDQGISASPTPSPASGSPAGSGGITNPSGSTPASSVVASPRGSALPSATPVSQSAGGSTTASNAPTSTATSTPAPASVKTPETTNNASWFQPISAKEIQNLLSSLTTSESTSSANPSQDLGKTLAVVGTITAIAILMGIFTFVVIP